MKIQYPLKKDPYGFLWLSINRRGGIQLIGYSFGHPSYSPPSLCARVVRSDRRSFTVEIYHMDTAREEDA
ncbi:hypothetical protein BHM03_00055401 [Ensete ventricosum]|nr:hypothetical protein BHM03_00055401 [Ensete ventricosum]